MNLSDYVRKNLRSSSGRVAPNLLWFVGPLPEIFEHQWPLTQKQIF